MENIIDTQKQSLASVPQTGANVLPPAGIPAVAPDHGAIEAAKHGIARSPKWSAVEHEFRNAFPLCAACPAPIANPAVAQVHHVIPFHFCILLGRPDLELDHRNLITLCESRGNVRSNDHHLLIGHFDDWRSSNLAVRADAIGPLATLSSALLRASQAWHTARDSRTKEWQKMTNADKQAMMALITTLYGTIPLLPNAQ